jgi:YD repeat-containing protein
VTGQLLTELFADSSRYTFAYDEAGNRTTMVDSSGQTLYAFNPLNWMFASEWQGLDVSNSFDSVGNRYELLVSSSEEGYWSFDADNRIAGAGYEFGQVTTMQYDPGGRLTTQLNLDGSKRRFTYDAASQVVSIIDEDSSGTPLQRFTFTYDEDGNRKVIVDANGSHTTYTYDAKDRLTQDHTTGTNAHLYNYSYDLNDNRLTENEKGSVTTYVYNAFGQITTSVFDGSISTYTYDDNGNLVLVNDGTYLTTMAYDKENRMVSHIHGKGDAMATYMYDADSLKRIEINDGARVTLLYDGSQLIQEIT